MQDSVQRVVAAGILSLVSCSGILSGWGDRPIGSGTSVRVRARRVRIEVKNSGHAVRA